MIAPPAQLRRRKPAAATIAPERKDEFPPGLDPELLELIQPTAEVKIAAQK